MNQPAGQKQGFAPKGREIKKQTCGVWAVWMEDRREKTTETSYWGAPVSIANSWRPHRPNQGRWGGPGFHRGQQRNDTNQKFSRKAPREASRAAVSAIKGVKEKTKQSAFHVACQLREKVGTVVNWTCPSRCCRSDEGGGKKKGSACSWRSAGNQTGEVSSKTKGPGKSCPEGKKCSLENKSDMEEGLLLGAAATSLNRASRNYDWKNEGTTA